MKMSMGHLRPIGSLILKKVFEIGQWDNRNNSLLKMRTKTVDRLLKSTPKDLEIFVDLYADLVVRINQILLEKGLSQKDLAEKLEKSPSEISKWLSGDHNFTLRSLAKLSAELGEPLLEVPKKQVQTEFVEDGFKCRVCTFVTYTKIEDNTTGKVWRYAEDIQPLKEVNHVG